MLAGVAVTTTSHRKWSVASDLEVAPWATRARGHSQGSQVIVTVLGCQGWRDRHSAGQDAATSSCRDLAWLASAIVSYRLNELLP
jgi:hypothetical protein